MKFDFKHALALEMSTKLADPSFKIIWNLNGQNVYFNILDSEVPKSFSYKKFYNDRIETQSATGPSFESIYKSFQETYIDEFDKHIKYLSDPEMFLIQAIKAVKKLKFDELDKNYDINEVQPILYNLTDLSGNKILDFRLFDDESDVLKPVSLSRLSQS